MKNNYIKKKGWLHDNVRLNDVISDKNNNNEISKLKCVKSNEQSHFCEEGIKKIITVLYMINAKQN